MKTYHLSIGNFKDLVNNGLASYLTNEMRISNDLVDQILGVLIENVVHSL